MYSFPWDEGLLQMNSFSLPPAFSSKIVSPGAVSTPAIGVINLVLLDCLWTDLAGWAQARNFKEQGGTRDGNCCRTHSSIPSPLFLCHGSVLGISVGLGYCKYFHYWTRGEGDVIVAKDYEQIVFF